LMHRLKHFYGEEQFHELKIDEATVEVRKMGDKPTCDKCLGTGTRGRVGIHEVLRGTTEMKKLVAKKAPVAPLRDQAIADGMRTLMQDGIYKIFKGVIDFEQLQRVCHH
jgi:type II secretory ATPase GspE/PulE/Tfp pilus assembly ATPase PilB-like protein